MQFTASASAAILVSGVHKAYVRGGVSTPVLRGLDLRVETGECVFLTGPSGSGKTTLLSILGCILTPDRGTVRVLGRELNTMDDRQRGAMRRERLGFVFQRFHLIRGLTAAENVSLPLTLCGWPPEKSRRRAAELLAAVGLKEKADNLSKALSTGQCQRVAMARALAVDPHLVLADEPTASLDAATGQEVMELLRRLTVEQGKSAVVVTHDPRIFHFADRICCLEDGALATSSTPRTPTAVGQGGSAPW